MASSAESAPPPAAKDGLRLLSLDGGGVRGLSELFILQAIMRSIDPQSPPKPCDVFDLICGSSSGGLIALILGRLRMTVEESIYVYIEFQKEIFRKTPGKLMHVVDIRGRLKSRYSAEALEKAVKSMLLSRGLDQDVLLREANLRSAVTVVVATSVVDSRIELFSSYHASPLGDQQVRIWEAARATTAAPSFFDPVSIGPYQKKYVDGGMGANNPVRHTVQIAKEIWPEADIACLVSIGCGTTRLQSVPTQLLDMMQYLAESERTAEMFARSNRDMTVADRYFRFNVSHGMEKIRSDEWSALENIVSATRSYSMAVATVNLIERCAEKLRREFRLVLEAPMTEVIEREPPIDHHRRIRPQEDISGTELAATSQPEPSLTDVLGESVSDVNRTSRGQEELPQAAGDAPSTFPDGQVLFDATKTWSKVSEEEDILMKDIADCILSDTEMRLLILTASDKIGDSRLKQNLAILLEDFAQRLTIEKLFGHLPNFVGSRAPGVIDYVFKALPADRTDRKDTIDSTPTLPTYDDAIFARDEVEDLGEVERTFEALDKLQIKVTRDLFSSLAIQQSTPFQQLSEDLRRFIFPSTKSYIREIIGHSLPHTNLVPIHSMLVRVDCELRKFLSQELDTTADMSEMMTLTGTLIQAQALPCRAYMDKTWPQSGLQILEVVKYALENDKSYYQHGPSHSIQLEILEEYLVAQIDGRPHEIIETVEQLAWLASTFRFGTLQSIGLSETEFRVVPGPTGSEGIFAEIILRPIRSIPESELSLGSCWTSLFDRSVLTWGFPVAERGDLHGLELSFELLLKASGARFPVEFQESIIIRQGPLTVFPVARGSVGTQWHVTLGGLDEFFDKINSFPLLPVQDDINTFLHGRHVLGWLNRAQLKLGTEQPSNRTSGAKEETSRGFQLGEELSVAVSIKPPWVGTTIGAKFVIPRAQMQRFENNRMDFEQQLERLVNTPALYYDCSTRTGWVVPELSLLLNLVHAHLFRYHSQSDALYDIRYADLLPDGGNAALAAIRSCNTTVLWESRRKGEEVKQYYFSDLVQFYLECFENRKEAIRVRVEHNELKADLGLRGWDYGDLRDCTAFFRYRRISPPYLSGRPDWWSLTKNPNLMVVLGSDIGQVIIPDRAVQRPCSLWSEVPPKYNLLVCLVRCVEEICRPWESGLPRMQLSQKFCWHQPENSRPFGDCLGRGCNPVQKLRDVSGWNPFHGLRNPDGTSPDGAVIFGIPNDTTKHVELQPRSCHPLNVIAPTPPRINHLRTKPTGFPQGWMFELSKTMRKLRPSAADIVPLSVIAGVAGGCVFIFMLRGRRW